MYEKIQIRCHGVMINMTSIFFFFSLFSLISYEGGLRNYKR